MLYFKCDIMELLKSRGFTTYYLRQKNIVGQKTIQDMTRGIVPGIKSIDAICELLNCQPGDIIGYKKE